MVEGDFMKKLISHFGMIFIITISLWFAGCDNGTTSNEQGTTLVCLGNSLTAGYGAATPGKDDKSKSYPAYLQKKVNIPVINAGVSGDTSAQGLARVESEVLANDPRIVIIELGANDVFQGIPITTTKENLQSIIDKVDNGNRKIYIAKFYTEAVARAVLAGNGISNDAMQTAVIKQYDDMYNTLVASNNVVLIENIWDGVWGIHMSDGFHPNAKGYEIMADNYFKALEPYLKENNLMNKRVTGPRGIKSPTRMNLRGASAKRFKL
ncbi:MAG: GDSL-type esterase/lipase family protein [Treponema sp.]|jgi:acyl-CoA thioesterase-1|nr:GDSL-type esterase/lipase family protein [Treponema sp.]